MLIYDKNVVCSSRRMVGCSAGWSMHAGHVCIIVRERRFRSQIHACLWCIYDARSLRGGLVLMQTVRVI